MTLFGSSELRKQLKDLEKQFRGLSKATEDLTKEQKEEIEVKKEAIREEKEELKEDIRGAERRERIAGGIAAVALRGLADPRMTAAEVQRQVAGAAVGAIPFLGPSAGRLAGELGVVRRARVDRLR